MRKMAQKSPKIEISCPPACYPNWKTQSNHYLIFLFPCHVPLWAWISWIIMLGFFAIARITVHVVYSRLKVRSEKHTSANYRITRSWVNNVLKLAKCLVNLSKRSVWETDIWRFRIPWSSMVQPPRRKEMNWGGLKQIVWPAEQHKIGGQLLGAFNSCRHFIPSFR